MTREDDSNALRRIVENTEDAADIVAECSEAIDKLCLIIICSTIVIVGCLGLVITSL